MIQEFPASYVDCTLSGVLIRLSDLTRHRHSALQDLEQMAMSGRIPRDSTACKPSDRRKNWPML